MKIGIYDATLTEGAREAGLQLSVRDKLRIALRLAEMGVAFVEAGWPGGRGADAEIFRVARRLELGGARLCACATLAPHGRAEGDRELGAAIRSGTPAVTLSIQVAPGARGGRAAAHVAGAVAAVRRAGRAALVELDGFFDAMHDGGRHALGIVEQAARAGAEGILLSDTTGGALPHAVEQGVMAARRAAARTAVGIRA
ncbi:MAG TPA: hypothetical protein VF904_01510, partial [Anaeromyxobacteraceae bacterium]